MNYYKHPGEITANKDFIHEISRVVKHSAFDHMTRILYSTDASIYQMVPIGVAFPRNNEEVRAVIELCVNNKLPVLPRGGGSSLAGQAVGHAVILDFSRYMNAVLDIDVEGKTVSVQPGITLGKLNKELGKYGLAFGPDPASGDRATIGGIIGNNATGAHSIVYGMAHDHVLETSVVLANGEYREFGERMGGNGEYHQQVKGIIDTYGKQIKTKFPRTFRSVAGYNLNVLQKQKEMNLASLMVGSEGTLGIITGARLKLVRKPGKTILALVHFNDLKSALDAVPEILTSNPSAVEMIDKMLLDLTRDKPEYRRLLSFVEGDPEVVLVVEYAGETDVELNSGISKLGKCLKQIKHRNPVVVLEEKAEQEKVWFVRKVGLGILLSVPGDAKPTTFIEDAAVPVEYLSDYIIGITDFANAVGVERIGLYAHASAGCIHVRPLVNLKSASGLQQIRQIAEKSLELVLRFGGTTSGEHGEGIARGEFSQRLFGPEITQAFREIKELFDPHNLMNPGKVVDAPAMDDESLMRYGTRYSTVLEPVNTQFNFDRELGFASAVEMCNGAGVCRKEEVGVMCPSFQGTRDEVHSTRGRANALRAAMMGWLGTEGMADKELYRVMDLCLSCQTCKTECPSGVDLAKLKAEFLYNYHRQHGFPIRSRIFSNIAAINMILQPVASLANLGMEFPGNQIMNWLGVHPKRNLPALATVPFSSQYKKYDVQKDGKPVVFFHDTFVEHNDPQIGLAAIRILVKAGYKPILIDNKKCCGRPAVSKGLLHDAKRMAEHNVDLLYPYANKGIPIVGCEPSCMAMFVNEYLDLVPGKKSRAIAKMTSTVEALIAGKMKSGEINFSFDEKKRRIVFHGHCQQKANFSTEDTVDFLKFIPNCEVKEIDAGCCGMAGSFGYEKEHYDLSVKIAELRLAPAIRQLDEGTIICATGTSCRDQIEHTTSRQGLHPVEIFADAIL